MMSRPFFIILNLLQAATLGSSCYYYSFNIQPPHSLNCNPYGIADDGVPVWRLRMKCEVDREREHGGQFNVNWFRKDPSNGVVENLGRVETLYAEVDVIAIRYGKHILNYEFIDSMLGDYWCQVINTTTQPHTYLGMSNVLTILHPDQYDRSLESCARVNSKTTTCADKLVSLNTTNTGCMHSRTSLSTMLATVSPSVQPTGELEANSSTAGHGYMYHIAYAIITILAAVVLVVVIEVICLKRNLMKLSKRLQLLERGNSLPPSIAVRQTAPLHSQQDNNENRVQNQLREPQRNVNTYSDHIYTSINGHSSMELNTEYSLANMWIMTKELSAD